MVIIVAIDIDYLARSYFWFDEVVPYQLDNNKIINIYPIQLKDSEIFMSSCSILSIDKNSSSNPQIITMSYLQFLVTFLLIEEANRNRLVNILKLCLGWNTPQVVADKNGKFQLYDKEQDVLIKSKQFNEIRRIIMYQNLIHYDDSYVNPDIKKAIEEYELVSNKGIDYPNLERKMAIITAHNGISKQAQMKMTYRSFTLLFEEVCGEVDFSTTRTAVLISSMFSNKQTEQDHWIYKKQKSKYDKYFVDDKKFNKSMGGNGNIAVSSLTNGEGLSKMI